MIYFSSVVSVGSGLMVWCHIIAGKVEHCLRNFSIIMPLIARNKNIKAIAFLNLLSKCKVCNSKIHLDSTGSQKSYSQKPHNSKVKIASFYILRIFRFYFVSIYYLSFRLSLIRCSRQS